MAQLIAQGKLHSNGPLMRESESLGISIWAGREQGFICSRQSQPATNLGELSPPI